MNTVGTEDQFYLCSMSFEDNQTRLIEAGQWYKSIADVDKVCSISSERSAVDLPSFIVSRLENSLSKEKKREVCWWQMFSVQSLSTSQKDDSRDGEMTQ